MVSSKSIIALPAASEDVVHHKFFQLLIKRYANNCEACKVLATELQARLGETGKTHEVLEFG